MYTLRLFQIHSNGKEHGYIERPVAVGKDQRRPSGKTHGRRILEVEIANTSRHEDEESQIAFSVFSVTDFGPVTVDTNVPYSEVHTNIGGTWQPQINSFLATKAGVYLFSGSIGTSSGTRARAAIVHTTGFGEQRVGSMTTSLDSQDGNLNLFIIAVDVDDYVSVQLLSEDNGVLY